MSLRAAALSRRGCTSRSRISPSLSTARHSHRRLPPDHDRHFVEVPLSAWPRPKPTEVAGESWPELQNPAPNGLVGHVEPALRQEFLHIAVAQREPEIEPDRVSDDLGWKLMTGIGDGLHTPTLPPPSVSVTRPGSVSIWRNFREEP